MLSLLSLATKPVGKLTDKDLMAAAKAIAGDDNPVVLDFFKTLRAAEPSATVDQLLRTPSALAVLQAGIEKLKAGNSTNEDGGLICRCPNCQFPFIVN